MIETQVTRFTETRAKALLTVALTSRDDLVFTDETHLSCPDFFIQVNQNNKSEGRLFAIELKATVRKTNQISVSAKSLVLYRDCPFPVCLCFYFMSDDFGYYKWLVEPTVDAKGRPHLVPSSEPKTPQNGLASVKLSEFETFDENGLADIVERVNSWYDARRLTNFK